MVYHFGPLAQLVEQAAHNRSVVGSSPARSILFLKSGFYKDRYNIR